MFCYFDLLSNDLIRHIWQICDNETRYTIVDSGLFPSIVREEIYHIVIHPDRSLAHNDGTLALSDTNDPATYKRALKFYGNSIIACELSFTSKLRKPAFLSLITEHCTKITSLMIRLDYWDEYTRLFLDRVGAQLQILEMDSHDSRMTESAAMLIAFRCKGLKKFRFTGRGAAFLSPIWISLGRHLEQVGIRSKFESELEWRMTLSVLEVNCTNLKSILLSGLELDGDQVAELLIRYGSQLEEAMASRIAADRALEVGMSCVNLQRCVVIEKDASFRTVLGFGQLLTELFLSIPHGFDGTALKQASASCSNIVKLVIERTDEIEYMALLFHSPKRHLKALEIDVSELRKCDLNRIAHSTGNLKRISIDALSIEDSSLSAFNVIAEKNPCIESVSITFEQEGLSFSEAMTDSTHVDLACDIAQAFQNCRSLKVMELSNRKLSAPFANHIAIRIQSAFTLYRFRGVRAYIYSARI